MKGLLVIHTETSYLAAALGRDVAERNRELFDRIADEVGRRLQRKDRVYFLAGESKSPKSDLIYPAIREYSPRMIFVPCGTEGAQFLRTKERVMADGLEQIELCGVAHDCCVKDIHQLLRGEVNFIHDNLKRMYRENGNRFGWPKEKFDRILKEKLNAQVSNGLTDGGFWVPEQ